MFTVFPATTASGGVGIVGVGVGVAAAADALQAEAKLTDAISTTSEAKYKYLVDMAFLLEYQTRA
jgi:hypothetical protein